MPGQKYRSVLEVGRTGSQLTDSCSKNEELEIDDPDLLEDRVIGALR